jgi:hypothetical protein
MIADLFGLPEGQITLKQVVTIIASPLLGMVTHEVMHYTTARSMGQWAEIDPFGDAPPWAVWAWQPGVNYEMPDSSLKARAILLAPVLTGLASLFPLSQLSLSGWVMIPVGLWWFIHTFGGGIEDYSLAFSQGDVNISLHAKQQAAAVACFAIFMILGQADASIISNWLVVDERLIRTIGVLRWNIQLAAMYSTLVLMAMSLRSWEKSVSAA